MEQINQHSFQTYSSAALSIYPHAHAAYLILQLCPQRLTSLTLLIHAHTQRWFFGLNSRKVLLSLAQWIVCLCKGLVSKPVVDPHHLYTSLTFSLSSRILVCSSVDFSWLCFCIWLRDEAAVSRWRCNFSFIWLHSLVTLSSSTCAHKNAHCKVDTNNTLPWVSAPQLSEKRLFC